MTYRALITDLDGTAVAVSSMGEDVPESTVSAIKSATESGKYIACATGRGWVYAKNVVKALHLTAPCIIEGGTRIIDPLTERTLWEQAMPDSAAAQVYDIFLQYAKDSQFVTSNRELLLGSNAAVSTVAESNNPLNNLRYEYVLGVTMEQAKAIVNSINQSPDVIAHITPSWHGHDKHDVHVTSRKATKEHAIRQWCKFMEVSPSEVIGFGDSGNDIPIFQAVGLKVAPTTATDEVLALADYVAPSPNDRGLEHVINTKLMK